MYYLAKCYFTITTCSTTAFELFSVTGYNQGTEVLSRRMLIKQDKTTKSWLSKHGSLLTAGDEGTYYSVVTC